MKSMDVLHKIFRLWVLAVAVGFRITRRNSPARPRLNSHC